MARTKRSDLSARTNRLGLAKGCDHAETLSAGCYIIYHRPKTGGSGTWRARWRNPETEKIKSKALGSADDLLESDGIKIFTFAEAQIRAGKFFEECSKALVAGTIEEPIDLNFAVREACETHIEELRRLGKDWRTPDGIAKAHIYPAFDGVAVARLTKGRIKEWHTALAEAPRRRTGQRYSTAGEWGEAGPTPEQVRARRSTANRILAVFTAAMNYCAKEGLISDEHTPWRSVHQFPRVKGQRLRFLSVPEQRALVAATEEAFRPLLLAALYTGSRFGPLAQLLVRDLNILSSTLYIQRDKGGTRRHILLVDEAREWFEEQAKGKKADDFLLPRLQVKRITRTDAEGIWLKDDTKPFMKRACEKAEIEYLTFHELRHTYASALVNEGISLKIIADQLGHRDTRMVEEHYGHLAKGAVAKMLNRQGPKLRLTSAVKRKKST